MKTNNHGKRNITVEQAAKILRKNGIECDEKEAKIILDFLYILAKLTVNQYINNQDGDDQ